MLLSIQKLAQRKSADVEGETTPTFTTASDGVPTTIGLLKAAAEETAAPSTIEFVTASTTSQQTKRTTDSSESDESFGLDWW